jgi:ribA/ribD-fused uncharacterized protein
MDTINFYFAKEAYGEFSNFALFPIEIDGKTWPTTEHYFQAQKFDHEFYREQIRNSDSPREAARLGRSHKLPINRNWEKIKDELMYKAVYAKFTQHQELKELLLSTGEARLVEHTRNDHYWGDGGDGSGKNMLGKILMRVREELKENE